MTQRRVAVRLQRCASSGILRSSSQVQEVMFELPALALINQLANVGLAPVIATRIVAADASSVHALVSEPAGQRRIQALIGPRLRPQARVVSGASSPVVDVGVRLAGHDVLWLTWSLSAGRGTTEVDLAAQLRSRGVAARLMLLLGGRRWLRRRLHAVLADVAAQALRAAEGLAGVMSDAPARSPSSRP